MVVALLRLDLRIPGCGSLKEKRHVVKTLTSAIRNRFGVAVAETGSHDLWQRTEVGVAVVSGEVHQARRVAHEVERFVDTFDAVETIASDVTLHAPEDV
jgi:uncharacterized protein YlxP (DUF503 family)